MDVINICKNFFFAIFKYHKYINILVTCGLILIILLIFYYYNYICTCACAQSCLTLWDTMGCSPRGSSVHGILQARILK